MPRLLLSEYRSVIRTVEDTEQTADTVGTRLRRLREQRGLSLSELSRRSGVGKGTISELEHDRRGARLDTLFALTTALRAPLGAALPAADGPTVSGDSVAATALGHWTIDGELVEAYRATLTPRRQLSAPHGPGVMETVTVIRGRVRVGAVDAERVLGVGESVRYPGDRPHAFCSLGRGPAEVVLLMHYPIERTAP